MNVLVLADNMKYAKLLMSEFYRVNAPDIKSNTSNKLYFKDGSVLIFASVLVPIDMSQTYDQIFTTKYVYEKHRGLLGLAEGRVYGRSFVPDEFVLTILEE